MDIKKIDFKSGVGWYNAPANLMEEAWTPQNHSNSQFAISTDNLNNLKISQWLVEDGSYMRLKNIQLGYALPKAAVDMMKMQKLRIWLGANNLFTFTKYSGLDPEIGSSDPTSAGIDYGYYPQARTFTLGISATF
jgi:outer membrane receptor protein involved in Fe transport